MSKRTHRDVTAENDFCLYRLYDEEHDLLYVGATHNFRNRMRSHRADQVWWQDVYEPYTLTEWFDSPREVADAEAAAIRSERPVWNRAGRTSAMIRYSPPPTAADAATGTLTARVPKPDLPAPPEAISPSPNPLIERLKARKGS